jgi:hypothetical protein
MAVLQLLFQTRIPDVIRRPRAHTCVAKPISRRESWKAYTYGGVPPASAGFPCTCGRNVPCRGGFHSDQGSRQRIFLRVSGEFLLRLRSPVAKKWRTLLRLVTRKVRFSGEPGACMAHFHECIKNRPQLYFGKSAAASEQCPASYGTLILPGLGGNLASGGWVVGRLAKTVMKGVDGQFEFV